MSLQRGPGSRPPDEPEAIINRSLHRTGFVVRGSEIQDMRLLNRVSKIRFTAINESGLPLLTELMKLAKTLPRIRSALSALAGCLRATSQPSPCNATVSFDNGGDVAGAIEKYHHALIGLREKVSDLQATAATYEDVLEGLGSGLLLTTARFPSIMHPEQSHDWSLHMVGMISLIETLDKELVDSSNIGRLAKEMAAYLDISALSLGRTERSRRSWLEWHVHPPGTPPEPDFCPLEIVVGYPKSFLTILAALSALLEDPVSDRDNVVQTVLNLHRFAQRARPLGGPRTDCSPPGTERPKPAMSDMLAMMESVLTAWQPPDVPPRLSTAVACALTTAWEIFRKAGLMYMWRGGFRASVLVPFPHNINRLVIQFIREILLGLWMLLDLAEEQITIMNIMTWPLMVIANECGSHPSLQDEIRRIIKRMQRRFSIEHLTYSLSLLEELWQKTHEYHHDPNFFYKVGRSGNLSLDNLSVERGICIPLF